MQLFVKQNFADVVRGLIAGLCPSDGTSLDVGCGAGLYHDAYRNTVVGVDKNVSSTVSGAIRGVVEHLPLRPNAVNFVTSFQTIYYVRNLTLALGEMHRVTGQGATLLISVSKPRAIGAEDPSYCYQQHGAAAWMRLFSESGFQPERLMPQCEFRLLFATLRTKYFYSFLSPYFWFLLRKAQ